MSPVSSETSKNSAKNLLVQQRKDSKCVVYLSENGVVEKRKRPMARRVCNLTILAVLFSALVICVCLYFLSSVVEKNVLAELKRQQRQIQSHSQGDGAVTSGYAMGGLSSVMKRNAEERRKRRRRRRRDNSSQKSVLHMQIVPGDNCRYDYQSRTYFVWSEGDDRTNVNFRYVRHPVFESPHDVVGVKVLVPGMYEIYSQAVIKGLNNLGYPYYCAQEIVRLRRGEDPQVLLKSFATQKEFNMNGLLQPPVDSVYQHGVFYLRRNDEVRVATCRLVIPGNGDENRPGFYFGIVQK